VEEVIFVFVFEVFIFSWAMFHYSNVGLGCLSVIFVQVSGFLPRTQYGLLEGVTKPAHTHVNTYGTTPVKEMYKYCKYYMRILEIIASNAV
jgi:hypothetical protein